MRINRPQIFDRSLNFTGKILNASKVSVTYNLMSPSQATVIMPDGNTGVEMHDFVTFYDTTNTSMFYRLTSESETITQDRQLTFKHAIDTLDDEYYPGELDYDGTVRGFLEAVFAAQTTQVWQLGECENQNAYKRKGINHDKLSDLFWEVLTREHDYYPAFDFYTRPFTVNIIRMSESIEAELRLRRNVLKGIKITRNDKNMCNFLRLRVSTQEDDGEVSVEKVYEDKASQERYGIIQKRETVFAEAVSDVDAWAERYLQERCKPTISISAPALQLVEQTYENWDWLYVGKLARVALPDYGETYIERVTSVNYPDVYGMPTYSTVNLASTPKSLSDAVRETAMTASRSAGGLSIAERDLTYWEMRVSKIKLAQDATGITEMYVTGIELDAESGARIYSVKQGFVSQRAEILANSEAIELRVMKNGVISAINLTSETATIQAKRIQLSGYVTASQLSATEASIKEAYAKDFTTITLVATSAKLNQIIFKDKIVYEKTLSVGSAASIPVLTTSASTISFNHKHTATVNSDGSVTIGGAIAI